MSKHAVLALTECLHLEVQAPDTTTFTCRPCCRRGGVQHLRVRRRCRRRRRRRGRGRIPARGDARHQGRGDGPAGGRRGGVRAGRRRAGSICSPNRTTSARRWPNAPMCLPLNGLRYCGHERRFDPRNTVTMTSSRTGPRRCRPGRRVRRRRADAPARAWPPCAPRLEVAPLPDDMPAMAAVDDHAHPARRTDPGAHLPTHRRRRPHRCWSTSTAAEW